MERNEVVVLDFDTQKEEEKDTRLSLFFGLKIDFFIDLYSLILNQEFRYSSTTGGDSVRDER